MAKRYEYCWRARSVGEDAETIAELIAALRVAAAELEEMAKAGIDPARQQRRRLLLLDHRGSETRR